MSLGVGGVSIPISIVCGVLLGTVAAVRRDSFIDRFVMLIGNFGNVIPPFVLGPVLVWIFAILLTSSGDGWLPAAAGVTAAGVPAAADRAADLHQHVAARARDARLDDRDAVEQLSAPRAQGLPSRRSCCAMR